MPRIKNSDAERITQAEIAKREKDVIGHFLASKPEPHKPLGKTAQAKRRKKEKRAK